MNAQAVRPAARRDKSPSLRAEAVEEAWDAFVKARGRAMTSARIEDGLRCGRRWGEFLMLFERQR